MADAAASPIGATRRRADGITQFVQIVLGAFCYTLLLLPYCRRISGWVRPRASRCLYVCNHVSLLDTILLGGLFWSRRALPILVLGDRGTWRQSPVKRMLSWRLGFLLERGGVARARIAELKQYARSSEDFNLIVFPEGTRGDGRRLNPLQAGVYFIAREAKIPIVPVGIRNMQYVSTKNGRFHPIAGARKIEVRFGESWSPDEYLELRREDFLEALTGRMQKLID